MQDAQQIKGREVGMASVAAPAPAGKKEEDELRNMILSMVDEVPP